MAHVAVTGAAGNVGRALLDGFDDHEVEAFTHSEHDDVDSTLLDVTDPDDVAEKLDGFDVVVHLAGASSPSAEWDAVVDVNVHGTKHVFDAAVENDIDRVVFASSNHAVGTYNIEDPEDPETMRTDDFSVITPEDKGRPDSFYGISKDACEGVASYYAVRHGVEAVNLRIGWLMEADELREEADAPESEARFARAMWLSPRDCRDVVEKASTAELPENPVTLHGISRNADRVMSLSETQQAVGYRPRDDSSEVVGE
ncbi:NAD-dependent epimerase/dehydratase family protein [Halobium salinum]|uniref:NAD-dependent epimerase/dehydratase family protein n=1 Tax=Halobium salinum TaxID=1364940 RepID=A0ABD5PCT5_9EURY|nr:NAD(P)-dependent oxidoreductase [Halobium salinum]